MAIKTFPCEDFCFYCGKPFTRLHLRHIYHDDDCHRAYEEARLAGQQERGRVLGRRTGPANMARLHERRREEGERDGDKDCG